MRNVSGPIRALLLAAAVLLFGAACASSTVVTIDTANAGAPVSDVISAPEADTEEEKSLKFEATSEFLATAARQVEQSESMRFELFTEIENPLFDMGSRVDPLLTGESVGARSQIRMDLGSLMGPMVAMSGMDPSQLTMNMITDGDALYLNAPLFAELMSAEGGVMGADFAWLTTITEGWGRIDADSFGDGDVLDSMGMASGADAAEMLDMLRSVGDVLDGGPGEVRGVPTNIAHAAVNLGDVLAAQEGSLEDLGASSGELEAIADINVNLEVHVDDAGRVVRLEYIVDFGALAGDDPQFAGAEMEMWQRVDFFDFGGPTEIVIPVGAVDVTEDFKQLIAMGG